uniref:Putative HNH homing endonuclease n=1 Tax=Pediastrum duplex TaxID=3105 RepID=A0A2U8GIQ4_PEDDU|nr:putative HNH homing endonuclease [Pediastrum duplex]
MMSEIIDAIMQRNTEKSLPFSDWINNVSNQYLDFIQDRKEARKKESGNVDEKLYSHHIVPRFHYKKYGLENETLDLEENTVFLTFEEHIHAHALRFLVYKEYGDAVAVNRMSGLQEEGFLAMQQAGGQAVNVKLKAEKRCMHSIDFQREMAQRSIAKPDAKETRSKGGKLGARKAHQNKTVRIEDRFEWSYKGTPLLCTFNFDNAGDIVRELYKVKQTKLSRISSLIKGSRKTGYGWSCKKITDN